MTAQEIVEGLKAKVAHTGFAMVEDKQLITAAIAYIEASEADRAALQARIDRMAVLLDDAAVKVLIVQTALNRESGFDSEELNEALKKISAARAINAAITGEGK